MTAAPTTTRPMKVISYGGGVQSTAMLVLAVQGHIPDVDAALFANVGDDSEHPDSLRYVREIALHRVKRDGTTETLYQRLTKEGSRSLPIPVRMDNGAPGNRSCTADFKIRVIGKWLKQNGASGDNPATVCIGISTDEIIRVGAKKVEPYEQPVYPLIDLGYNRQDCMNIIRDGGLPVPGKSSCYFCPFHRPTAWQKLNETRPDLFDKAADLEHLLNERRSMLGKDKVWLTRFARPLRDAIDLNQQSLIPLDQLGAHGCDSGYCWT